MLAPAHSLLARLDVDDTRRRAVLDIFEDTIVESAAGEHSDVWLSLHLEEARSADVLAMADQKTAVYSFQAPLLIAAVLACADMALIDELATISRQIGTTKARSSPGLHWSMAEYNVGDKVTIIGDTMNGNIGTVEFFDEERGKYLVRVNDLAQHYYADSELEPFSS